MSKTFGRKQARMHPTIIKVENGYLGEYEQILNPGDTQEMNFESTDHGPF